MLSGSRDVEERANGEDAGGGLPEGETIKGLLVGYAAIEMECRGEASWMDR